MKRVLSPIIKFAINRAKKSTFVQSVFESPIQIDNFKKIGKFKDSYHNEHILFDRLRGKIKPGWEKTVKSRRANTTNISEDVLKKRKENSSIRIENLDPIIKSYGKSISNSTILEVGCNSGEASFNLADMGAKKVIGSDFSGYKIEATKTLDEKLNVRLKEVNEDLNSLRREISKLYLNTERVEFVDDNISNTNLKHESFDLIFSWEVLEHISDTKNAFKNMFSLLKKDGLMIHMYNPFFSLNGGHSMCTLDFLWGHTRLNNEDIEKYFSEFRPQEKERALSFFKSALNRMTLEDLHSELNNARFKIINILPFTKEQHVKMISSDILNQSKNLYPKSQLLDFVSPRVMVIAKK